MPDQAGKEWHLLSIIISYTRFHSLVFGKKGLKSIRPDRPNHLWPCPVIITEQYSSLKSLALLALPTFHHLDYMKPGPVCEPITFLQPNTTENCAKGARFLPVPQASVTDLILTRS